MAGARRQGAQTQRLFWASTGTKNPRYRDVIYVEELIGPDTVNTIRPRRSTRFAITGGRAPASRKTSMRHCDTMATLAEVGISMKEVTDSCSLKGCSCSRMLSRSC